MTKIYQGLKEIVDSETINLPLDDEKINNKPIDIFNFHKYVLGYKNSRLENLEDISDITEDEIKEVELELLRMQLKFSFNTTPAINYLFRGVFNIDPNDIKTMDDFKEVPPITKEHQRLLGWQNFVPAPIAKMYLEGLPKGKRLEDINPNLRIAQEKWTGGTTATKASDFVQIIIPDADWRASVQILRRNLNPIKDLIKSCKIGATTYDMRHIARPLWDALLKTYGKHTFARHPGVNDKAWVDQIKEIGAEIGIAPPADHPLKGIGWPGMFYETRGQFKVALMTSTIPSDELLLNMLKDGIAIYNVGGDTGSLPTYAALANPNEMGVKEALKRLENHYITKLSTALTEVVSPVSLTNSEFKEEGVIIQTNYASVWRNYDGSTCVVPALKSQMIRSSAAGNLVYVTKTNSEGTPTAFHKQILRYDDFKLDENLRPILGVPHTKGGSSMGGCAR